LWHGRKNCGMKRAFKISACVLAAVLCAALSSCSGWNEQNHVKMIDEADSGGQQLRYHFALIAQDMGDPFWQSVKKGALKAAEQVQAAVESDGPVVQDVDAELKYFNIAIAAKVDGIAVYVPDKTKFRPLINEAVGKGIKVITIESDDNESNREAYIGPDSYDVGQAQGDLIAQIGNSCPALILGGNYSLNSSMSNSLQKGLQNSLRRKLNISLQSVHNSGGGYFKAEEIIRRILYQYPKVNTVICTSENDTLEVVQVLIDLNRTKDINVIGYGNSMQIREYIRNSIVFGSVYESPEETGAKCIQCLADLMNGKEVPRVIKTSVYSITKNNLVNYPG
jgi:ribose transport system substrate-binding protein